MAIRIGRLTEVWGLQISLLVLPMTGLSQENSWTIFRSSGEPFVMCSLDSLIGTTLWFHRAACPESVGLESVTLLHLPENSQGAEGMLIGAVVLGAVGYFLAPGATVERHSAEIGPGLNWWTGRYELAHAVVWDEHVASRAPEYVLVGVGVGGAIGRLVGSQFGAEKMCDLHAASLRVKVGAVWSILHGEFLMR